jgi:hypothetical protein
VAKGVVDFDAVTDSSGLPLPRAYAVPGAVTQGNKHTHTPATPQTMTKQRHANHQDDDPQGGPDNSRWLVAQAEQHVNTQPFAARTTEHVALGISWELKFPPAHAVILPELPAEGGSSRSTRFTT